MVSEKRERGEIRKVVYSPIVADLFHYGHLQSLKFAQSLGDYHICGVLTDEAVESYRRQPIANLAEREAIISSLSCVDRVIIQRNVDPSENLKRIRAEYQDAELMVVYGSDWKHLPWAAFIEQIGGRIVQHPYYERLSEFKIINRLIESYKGEFRDFDDFTSYFKVKDFIEFDHRRIKKTIISTKANTLKALQPILKGSKIEKTFVFTVLDWSEKKEEIVQQIKQEFAPHAIVIRSSALNEDTFDSSMAGCFHSELNISSDDHRMVKTAIEKVIDSYKRRNQNNLFNQILVQLHTQDIEMSGVAFTRTLETNAPYHVINYDDRTGLSDTVTKGIENKTIQILRRIDKAKCPAAIRCLLTAIEEIEETIPNMGLDIEFAINKNGEVIIFQVRPIAINTNVVSEDDGEIRKRINAFQQQFRDLSRRRPHLAGDNSYFGDMPDWNPAEIIGNSPNHLDYSLYAYLIMDSVWHEARTTQGYTDVSPAKLMVLFGNKPYVDIRNSFNSFIPNTITKELREKLLSFYMAKLRQNPELQDKVEFEILYTCYDFSFNSRSRELLAFGLTDDEIKALKQSLHQLTNDLIKNPKHIIEDDITSAHKMAALRAEVRGIIAAKKYSPKAMIKQAHRLLDDCKAHGTLQFSRLARLAFIGKILLKSMVDTAVIDKEFYNAFLNSINTVATEINDEFSRLIQGELSKGEFLERYGHLRPGTYDITSLRYDANPDLLSNRRVTAPEAHPPKSHFLIDDIIHSKIDAVLREHKIDCTSKELFAFIRAALEAREFSKFEFTKSLSDAIELIAKAGELLGFSRAELSQLDLETIFRGEEGDIKRTQKIWKNQIESRNQARMRDEKISLPPIIFSEHDFELISYYTAKPNYITQKLVNGTIIDLDELDASQNVNLNGKIALLESGDPGYDWIFTRNIAGLITKYGGVASHMAIRCAEFGIPAAIGCGEVIFNGLKKASSVILDCKSAKMTPVELG
jgi:cytidyltransferase-like protein